MMKWNGAYHRIVSSQTYIMVLWSSQNMSLSAWSICQEGMQKFMNIFYVDNYLPSSTLNLDYDIPLHLTYENWVCMRFERHYILLGTY